MIELDSIAKEFGSARAVRNVSLTVAQGEFVSLLGPSGCGKTTTLRIIAGFEHPSGGSLRIGGRDMIDVPVEQRGVSMVFQNYALFPHLAVFENVAFGLRLRRLPWGEIAARTRDALDRVGLSGLEERRPRQLSGGQQQRVSLARALVVNPSVLLLDEPLSNLDLKLREQLRDEIRSLQRALGITAIYVTHDQAEAMAMSDRIAVMNAGVIEQLGSPREIYERPRTVFVASFIGQCNLLSGRFEESRFRTSGGLAFTAGGQTSAADTRLAIRPEAISISSHANGAGTDNRFSGRVVGTTYLGDRAQLDIALLGPAGNEAETIAAVWHMRRGEEVPGIGHVVTIAVDAADCVPVAVTAG